MNTVGRVFTGVKSIITDPYERRGYAARLKWLAGGTSIQAWSLEYRRGLGGRFDSQVVRHGEESESVAHCPINCDANAPLSHLYERRYTYEIPDTIANSITGATLHAGTSEPPFVIRESISWPFESILSHGLDIPDPKKSELSVEQPAVVFPATPNYYHWLVEELPIALRAKELFPDVTYLVNHANITTKHREAAQALKVDLTTVPTIIKMRNQVMPGRASDSWFIHPMDYARLHAFGDRIRSRNDNLSQRKLYISRRNSPRSLPGEAQLEDLLRTQGFYIAHLETMNWTDQVELFSAAQIIVGPHGAGLSNLVFSTPGATLIELTNGYHYNRCFEWVCHTAGHAYLKIEADSRPQPMSADELANEILDRV